MAQPARESAATNSVSTTAEVGLLDLQATAQLRSEAGSIRRGPNLRVLEVGEMEPVKTAKQQPPNVFLPLSTDSGLLASGVAQKIIGTPHRRCGDSAITKLGASWAGPRHLRCLKRSFC